MESKRNLIDIFHKKLKHELYKNDDTIKFTELLKNDKWQNIIKKYNIRDLYSLCFNNVFLFGIVKDDNFKNNLINLIKNDWSNIGKYNPLSIDEQREFGWKNYQLILKSIYCFDTESQHFYDLFDFFIEKKDSILTNNLYSLCSEINFPNKELYVNHINKKYKDYFEILEKELIENNNLTMINVFRENGFKLYESGLENSKDIKTKVKRKLY